MRGVDVGAGFLKEHEEEDVDNDLNNQPQLPDAIKGRGKGWGRVLHKGGENIFVGMGWFVTLGKAVGRSTYSGR